MAEVVFTGVRKRYGDTQVVHGVDLVVADGEFVVIVGPSGCGKSTLLRMVAGLEAITEGTIAIAGRVVNALEPKDRDIAMVFQNYALYPHMSVFDNIAYGLRLRGVARADVALRVKRAADILQLGDLLARKPRQLSGGQRQRVAMGRAIVRDPAAFLFDEPLSNLDAQLRTQMRLEIKKLHRSLGATSLFVTHDQVEAMTMADRLAVMHNGRVEQVGPPGEIYERPATRFVAGFIGSPAMNFVPARVLADERGIALGEATTLALANGAARGQGGRDVVVGLRPEHIVPAGATGAHFDLRVDIVELLGAETIVHGILGDGGAVLTARIPGTLRAASGDRLPLGVAPEHLHLFATDDGRRLTGH